MHARRRLEYALPPDLLTAFLESFELFMHEVGPERVARAVYGIGDGVQVDPTWASMAAK